MRRVRPAALLALLLATLPGCHAWQPRPLDAPALRQGTGRPLRVVRRDGSSLVLAGATIAGDSVAGWIPPADGEPSARVAIALADVARVEEEVVSARRTAAVAVGSAVGLAAQLLVVIVLLGIGMALSS